MKYSVAILFTVSVLLSACGSKEVKPLSTAEKPTPDWYLNPPQDTAQTLYGVGDGKNRDGAVKAGLVDLASKLSVQVESTFQSNLKVKEGAYSYIDRTSEKEIKSQVAQIQINAYQVSKVEKLAYGKYLAMVEVNRSKLFNDLLKQQQSQMNKVLRAEENLGNSATLPQYLFYKKQLEQLAGFKHNLLVMETLNPNASVNEYTDFLSRLENRASQLKMQLRFVMQADSNSQKFVAPIQNALTDAGFKIGKSPEPQHNAYVLFDANINPSKAYGFYIDRVALSMQVQAGAQQVGGNKLNLKGQATKGHDLALENAATKLQMQLNEQGLNNVLGLDLLPLK